MREQDWKRMIYNWQISQKHADLKLKLKRKKVYNLTKKEIEQIIEDVFEFENLSEEDKEAFDWLDPNVIITQNKEELILSLIETMLQWYYYQLKYEKLQDFELCAKIRDIIDIEINDYKRIAETYYSIHEDEDIMLQAIKEDAHNRVLENFDEWTKNMEEE